LNNPVKYVECDIVYSEEGICIYKNNEGVLNIIVCNSVKESHRDNLVKKWVEKNIEELTICKIKIQEKTIVS